MQGSIFGLTQNSGFWPKFISGIYRIYSPLCEFSYIGKSVNLASRWGGHRCALRGNYHSNPHLQNFYNKYGEFNIQIEILEICPEEDLRKKEYEWIENFDSLKNGFNQRGYELEDLNLIETSNVVKYFELLDPEGNVVSGYNLQKFARIRKLEANSLRSVMAGKLRSHKGYKSTNLDFHKKEVEKRIVSPEGELFIFTNSLQFCREKNLCSVSINSVLREDIAYHKGWHLEEIPIKHRETFNRFLNQNPIPFSVLNPEGMLIEGHDLKEFCDLNNLNVFKMKNVISDDHVAKIHRGYRNINFPQKSKISEPRKVYQLISPDGILHEFEEILKFSKDHNLSQGSIGLVLNSKQLHHKGWRLPKNSNLIIPNKPKINQIDPITKEVVKTWERLVDIGRHFINLGYSNSEGNITKCFKGERSTAFGFMWELDSDI